MTQTQLEKSYIFCFWCEWIQFLFIVFKFWPPHNRPRYILLVFSYIKYDNCFQATGWNELHFCTKLVSHKLSVTQHNNRGLWVISETSVAGAWPLFSTRCKIISALCRLFLSTAHFLTFQWHKLWHGCLLGWLLGNPLTTSDFSHDSIDSMVPNTLEKKPAENMSFTMSLCPIPASTSNRKRKNIEQKRETLEYSKILKCLCYLFILKG